MSKFKLKFMKPTFVHKGTVFVGLVWQQPNSKGDSTYSVTLHDKGFDCECPGFTFRGNCKHTKIVNNKIERALDGEVPEYYQH